MRKMDGYVSSVGIRFGAESEKPAGEELARWHLSEPVLANDAGSLAVTRFDCVGDVAPEVGDGHTWMFSYLDSWEVDTSRFEVLRAWEGDFGTRSLLLGGDAEELWGQIYLLGMLAGPVTMSSSLLHTDLQRRAWIGASAKFSSVITPWIWGDGDGRPRFVIERPVPQRLRLMLEPQMFASSSVFFSQVGERLLGPAGYAGRDLHGFAELMLRYAHLVDEFVVEVIEPPGTEPVADDEDDRAGFFAVVLEILSQVPVIDVRGPD